MTIYPHSEIFDDVYDDDTPTRAELEHERWVEDCAKRLEAHLAAFLHDAGVTEHDVREVAGIPDREWKDLLDNPVLAPYIYLAELALVTGMDTEAVMARPASMDAHLRHDH